VVKKKNKKNNSKSKRQKGKPKARIRARTQISSRKLAAIMFTDMVGYTALGQRNESLSLALVNQQRRIVRPIIKRHSGKEIDTIGDAFLVEFQSALDATRCAYDIQRTIREYNISLPEGEKFLLRIGVHVGDVVESRKGDISGDAVNVASRIEPLSENGGVCLSRQVYDHVKNKFELPLESLGLKSLKNVLEPLEVFKMMMPWQKSIERSQQKSPAESIISQLDRLRVAVLPFTSMSPDPNDAFFADGVTEELISALSKISGLQVIARTSVMRYKDEKKSVDEIGRELKVGTVLEGSIRKAGNKLRITAQLINSLNNEHLWSETYDRILEDVFAIQSDIATTVASALRVRLLPEETKRIAKEPTKNLEAHSFYLKGLQYFWEVANPARIRNAVKYFERAIELDPEFALAIAALGDMYSNDNNQTLGMSYEERISKSKELVTKALAIDPDLAEAHRALGNIEWAMHGRNREGWLTEEREFKRAIELDPNYASSHNFLGHHFLREGKFEEAMLELKKASELDPINLGYLYEVWKGWVLTSSRKFAEAEEHFTRFLKNYPEHQNMAHENLGLVCLGQSRFVEALGHFEKEFELAVYPEWKPYALAGLGVAYAKLGRKDDAMKTIQELESVSKSTGREINTFLAWIYCALGERGEAVTLLERANDQKEIWPFVLLKCHVLSHDLYNEPGFITLLKKIGFMSEQEAETELQKIRERQHALNG
jgi:adenylate cyclase